MPGLGACHKLFIHNFVLGKMEEKGKGRGWGGGWVLGALAPGAVMHVHTTS